MIAVPAPMSDTLYVSLPRSTVSVEVEITPDEVLRVLPDDRLRDECVRRGLLVEVSGMALAGDHIRGARGLLDWSVARLAAASGVSASTIKRLEDGTEGQCRPAKIAAILEALQGGGAQFRSLAGETCILLAPSGRASHDVARGAP